MWCPRALAALLGLALLAGVANGQSGSWKCRMVGLQCAHQTGREVDRYELIRWGLRWSGLMVCRSRRGALLLWLPVCRPPAQLTLDVDCRTN